MKRSIDGMPLAFALFDPSPDVISNELVVERVEIKQRGRQWSTDRVQCLADAAVPASSSFKSRSCFFKCM